MFRKLVILFLSFAVLFAASPAIVDDQGYDDAVNYIADKLNVRTNFDGKYHRQEFSETVKCNFLKSSSFYYDNGVLDSRKEYYFNWGSLDATKLDKAKGSVELVALGIYGTFDYKHFNKNIGNQTTTTNYQKCKAENWAALYYNVNAESCDFNEIDYTSHISLSIFSNSTDVPELKAAFKQLINYCILRKKRLSPIGSID